MFVRDKLRNYWTDFDEFFTLCVIWSNLKGEDQPREVLKREF